MRTTLRLFLFLLPVWLQAGFFNWFEPLPPKAQRAKDLLESFDEKIEKALIDYQVPGIAVGVVVDGRVVYSKGFGFRDFEEKLPMTDETVCAVGSCTKAFTTFVMGTLVDEGRLQWDEPVIDVLPQFRLWDQYATANLTLRDLLTHRSGMPRHEFVWYNAKVNKNELLKRIRYLHPSFDIRERYQYNNLMYFAAGLAIEEATGKTWEALVTERILRPLDMTYTNFSVLDSQKCDNFAYPYVEKHEELKRMPFRNLSLIGPAGSLNSNVIDLTHWIQLHLAGGVYNGQRLISPVTLQELHAPQVIVPGAPETKETLLYAYGIGWVVLSYRGHYFISHDGVSDGFTSVVGLLPAENIGVVVIANKNMTALPRYLSFEVIDRVLELPHHDWFKEGVDSIRRNKETMKEKIVQEDRSRKKGTSPSHPLEEYVGTYENLGYGPLTIELVDGKLRANYNDLLFVLDHWHYDVFNVVEEKQDMIVSIEGKKFTFCNEACGEIGRLIVPFEPTAEDIVFSRRPTERLSTLNYLKQFTGVYEIYGYVVEIVLRDHTLVAIIPGQPNYELVPSCENEFTVKAMTGSTARFIMTPDGKVEEILLIHPYGTFTASPRN